MQIKVTYDEKFLNTTLKGFVKELTEFVDATARANTPYRTGNARRNWTNRISNTNATIENKVPYIGKLEAGASRQAPKGIIGPTLTKVKGKYK